MKVHSMVGIIPLLATAVIDEDLVDRTVTFGKQFADFLDRQGMRDREKLVEAGVLRGEVGQQRLLVSCVGVDRVTRLLRRLLDAGEFLSPYGLRAISAFHRDHPSVLDVEGMHASVDYEPAESTTDMFGASSNWRRPVWFPLNYLAINALQRYHAFSAQT